MLSRHETYQVWSAQEYLLVLGNMCVWDTLWDAGKRHFRIAQDLLWVFR